MNSVKWMQENFIGRVVFAEYKEFVDKGLLGPLRAVDHLGVVVENGYTQVIHFLLWATLTQIREGVESDITNNTFLYKIGADCSQPSRPEETKRVLET